MQQIPADSLTTDSVLTDTAAIVPADTVETVVAMPGVEGEPLPYRLRTDDGVTGLLLLCFFITAWVVARSWHSLSGSLAGFFHIREHGTGFTEADGSRPLMLPFMALQTCLLLSLLFFYYMQERFPAVVSAASPYALLGAGFGLCCLYRLLRVALSRFVNVVFFGVRKSEQWLSDYHLVFFLFGVLLFPQVLLVMYSEAGFTTVLALFFGSLAVVKILLFYKSFSIFFNYEYGYLHLFLYFCTLEILPLLLLWCGLVFASTYLTN